ncbi:MAG: hypothetical protein RR206_09385, partial [Bacteroidaceae bacterium]
CFLIPFIWSTVNVETLFFSYKAKKEVFTPSCQICFGTNAEPSREEKRERRKEGPQTTFS